MSESMRRILAAAGRDDAAAEQAHAGAEHGAIRWCSGWPGSKGEDFGELAQLLYDQAQLTEQGQLANPGEYARRLNRLLLKLLA